MSLKCKDCAYHWVDEGEQYGTCHFVPVCAGDYSPCEQEDIDRQREMDRQYEEDLAEMYAEYEDDDDDPGPEDILADESKTAFEKFTDLLEYEGIIGYEHVIGEWLMELYGIDITEDPGKGEEK